ncbi:capsule assembly Wzi family protein [Spirosoma profusum]|nr:capsule assembly Wzi family protein [Spirosoma profusum]
MLTSGKTPFWLRANQYGTVPLQNSFMRLEAEAHADYQARDSTGYRPKMDWGYGANVIVNAGASSQVLLTEGYLKGRIGAFELYAGRRKEIIGLVDTLLTSGSYIWSGNALPFPKIQLALPAFTPIPFTKGVLSVMGTFSHGWFENQGRLVQGTYLHQSSFYGRIGKESWRFKFYGGFNHQVMWGGYSDHLDPGVSVNGKLPSNIKYYPAVILGIRNPFPDDQTIQTITHFEENRIGNHLGSIDLAAELDLNTVNFYAYRQFFYDDGSLFYGTNLDDGLNGLRIRPKRENGLRSNFYLSQITVEYLFTGSQGGNAFVLDDPKLRGRDDYFNNGQYLDGWTYFGRTVGTPFLSPQSEVRPNLPPRSGIANNRVSLFHLGLTGVLLDKINLTTKLSVSRNAGTYPIPYPNLPTQFSGLLAASIPLNILGGTEIKAMFAFDAGDLLPSSTGMFIALRKSGVLSGKKTVIVSPRSRF